MTRTAATALLVPLLAACTAALLSGCDTGSRALRPEYYVFTVDHVSQSAGGGLTVEGTTDLPDNTRVDALLATAGPAVHAAQRAVLTGSTETLGSQPVYRHHFRIALEQALTVTCRQTPPCGPFPAGRYLLVLDAAVPTDLVAGPEVLSDPRYLEAANGLRGTAALETTRTLSLHAIGLRVDNDGHQVNPDLMPILATTPTPTPH